MSKGGGSVDMPDPMEYLPLIEASADINRINQATPFGGTRYTYENTPLSEEDWLATNPTETRTRQVRNNMWDGPGSPGGRLKTISESFQPSYQSYLDNFDRGKASVESYLSPELQSIFSKQFSPDAYSQYSTDYMENAKRLLDPVYQKQLEGFQQAMSNRGQPVGGELYDDSYGNLMDAQNRGWESAAFGATQAAEQARLQDFNRLMAAMGRSTIPVPSVDTMGPANMAMNANMANAQNAANSSSNIWNTVAGLGGAYLMGAPEGAAIWG